MTRAPRHPAPVNRIWVRALPPAPPQPSSRAVLAAAGPSPAEPAQSDARVGVVVPSAESLRYLASGRRLLRGKENQR